MLGFGTNRIRQLSVSLGCFQFLLHSFFRVFHSHSCTSSHLLHSLSITSNGDASHTERPRQWPRRFMSLKAVQQDKRTCHLVVTPPWVLVRESTGTGQPASDHIWQRPRAQLSSASGFIPCAKLAESTGYTAAGSDGSADDEARERVCQLVLCCLLR